MLLKIYLKVNIIFFFLEVRGKFISPSHFKLKNPSMLAVKINNRFKSILDFYILQRGGANEFK